jgi:hypothetical protein
MMHKRLLFALTAATGSVIGLASPAVAQGRVPTIEASRVPAQVDPLGGLAVRRMNLTMAKCIVERQPEAAAEYLLKSDAIEADYGALGYGKDDLHGRLSLNRCLVETMSDEFAEVKLVFSHAMLRSHLAEAAYLARNRGALVKQESWTEVIGGRFVAPSDMAPLAKSRGDFSDCLVFHDPVAVDAIVRTEMGTAAERAAAKALVPTLSKCLAADSTFEVTPASIRQFAAAGLWARSHYQPAAASGAIASAKK